MSGVIVRSRYSSSQKRIVVIVINVILLPLNGLFSVLLQRKYIVVAINEFAFALNYCSYYGESIEVIIANDEASSMKAYLRKSLMRNLPLSHPRVFIE